MSVQNVRCVRASSPSSCFCPGFVQRCDCSWHRLSGVGQPPLIVPFGDQLELVESTDAAIKPLAASFGCALKGCEFIEIEPPQIDGQNLDAKWNMGATDLLASVLGDRVF